MLTQEARSTVTKEDVLKEIIRLTIRPVFRRIYLNRELVIGTIGDRGGGKSGSDAVIAITDFMMNSDTVYSNMDISCAIDVDNETAQSYGLNSGGLVEYRSLPLEKDALLKLDDRYRNCCLVIEEINVQYSNARRFMSNTNVDFNEVCQQLRKLQSSMLFNVIDEMFIDSQLRALTDIFLKTYDKAFDVSGLEAKKQTGHDFSWKIYPMTGYLAGEQKRYAVTKKTLPPVIFHFSPWHGVFNTWQHQEKGIYTMSTRDKNKQFQAEMSVKSSDEMIEEFNEWGWLADEATKLKESGIKTIDSYGLNQIFTKYNKTMPQVQNRLKQFGIQRKSKSEDIYIINGYDL